MSQPSQPLDPVEREYIQAINRATSPDEAYELSIGLREYRELYKITHQS